MERTCPHCGAATPDADAFCAECREPLDDFYPEGPAPPVTALPHIPVEELPLEHVLPGMTRQEIIAELDKGGRLVVYQYCISLILVSVLKTSSVHLIRAGEDAAAKGRKYTLLSVLLGWWGIPWGFIYTLRAAATNQKGGLDVTADVLQHLRLSQSSMQRAGIS
jgi:hypothetical protein